jgi:hypothetical protein
MMRTKLDDFDLIVEPGHGVLTLYLEPLQLVTGTYFVEAWFLNESDSISLTSKAGRSKWFSVKGAAMCYEENSGIFAPNARWAHNWNETSGGEIDQQRERTQAVERGTAPFVPDPSPSLVNASRALTPRPTKGVPNLTEA